MNGLAMPRCTSVPSLSLGRSLRRKFVDCNLFPNLIPAEVYSLTLVPMDTEAQALIQMIEDILDH